jgi:hypothetical protein
VEILDQWGRLKEDRGVCEADVRLQYPSLPQTLSQSNQVTLSVHCECTLVSAIVSRYLQNGRPVEVEIGVSKCLCAWCVAFIGMVHKRFPAISIRTTCRRGRNVAGWTFPPIAPQELMYDMQSSVEAHVQDICAKTKPVRRSDCEPTFTLNTEQLRLKVVAKIQNSGAVKRVRKWKYRKV